MGRGLIGLVALLALGSFDWRCGVDGRPPELLESVKAQGPLSAGASSASIAPPYPVPLGGYNTRGGALSTGIFDEPHARAVVLEIGGKRIALVSIELVVLPAALRTKISAAVADLKLDALVVAATHTHAGPGGYWDKTIAEVIGLGGFEPRIEAFLVERTAAAIRDATSRLAPATFSSAEIEASNYSFNRSKPGGPVDPRLSALRIDGEGGKAIARIVVFAAHPTILPRDSMRLSGDWPAAMMSGLEESGGSTALFWQGAEGDVTWGKRQGALAIEERVVRFGRAVAADARGAIAAAGEGARELSLSFARVRVHLPACDAGGFVWGPFEPVASNLLHWAAWSDTTEVSMLRLGDRTLAFVPGEPVAALGLAWREDLGGAVITSLADDYVGYVEEPSHVEAETGESQRQYFGPGLATSILEGLRLALGAVQP